MRARERVRARLNEEFRTRLAERMRDLHGVEVETSWNVVSDRLVTRRVDGKPFLMAQAKFLQDYELGFTDALAAADAALSKA